MKFTPQVSESTALLKRLSHTSERDTIRGTPFHGVQTKLLAHCGADAVKAALAEAEITEQTFNALKTYPLRAFLRFEYSAASRLADALGSFDEAIFQMGAAAVDPFFNSVAGRTMKILSGNEPHRMFSAVPSGYQLLVTAGKREYEKTGARSGSFHFSGDLLGPVHNSGIFDAALREIYDICANFDLEESSLLDYKFHISW